MEPAQAPWAEHEKVYLLAEIIKSSLPSHVLLSIIRDSNIQPKWNDIALPHGRSLRSCQMAFTEMNATYPPMDFRQQQHQQLQQQQQQQQQQQRPQLPTPILYPGPDIAKKRPHQPEVTTPMGRLIQPRPPHAYSGEFVSGPTYAMSPIGEPANKKKRGRPTKAEAQARADAAAARGEVYPPPRRSRPSITSLEPPSAEAQRPGATPPGSTPARAMTPQQAPMERGSESSSGKRKRNKPTPLELEKSQREPSEAESPLAFGSASGDQSRSQAYSSFTPISAPLPSGPDSRDRDVRMEGVEETQPRTTTPHSFKDTVGI